MALPKKESNDSNTVARKFKKLSGSRPDLKSQTGRHTPPIPAGSSLPRGASPTQKFEANQPDN